MVPKMKQDNDAVRGALHEARRTITDIARELGVVRGTMDTYNQGIRRMPVHTRYALTKYLRRRAVAMLKAADRLSETIPADYNP